MYQVPTRADFDRKLRALIQDARTTSEQETNRIGAELAARGLGASSGPVISTIADRFDEIHSETLDRAVHLIHDFTNRMELPATEIASWARPLLGNLAGSLLLGIPAMDRPDLQQRVQSQYSLKFAQRLDDALRDIEIGFIGDRSMTVKDFDRRALVLRKLYDERHSDRFLPVPFDPSTARDEQETTARICRQLSESGLIEWCPTLGESQGSARITARGIDVIEGKTTSPIAINIVHSSSNVQIGEGNAQSFTFSGEKIVAAINNSNAPTAEKEKAKSAWQSVLDSSVLTKVIGLFTGA